MVSSILMALNTIHTSVVSIYLSIHVSEHQMYISTLIFPLNFSRLHVSVLKQKLEVLDFPDGTVGRDLPAYTGAGVQPLVWEGPTCHGTAKPVHHDYGSLRATAPPSHTLSPCATVIEACTPRACTLQREATTVRSPCTATKRSPRSPQLERKPVHSNKDPAQPKIQLITVHAKLLQSCPSLCDPMDCSPPGSSVHGILQARILEWVAIPFSRGSSQPRNRTRISTPLLHWEAGSLPLAFGKPIN